MNNQAKQTDSFDQESKSEQNNTSHSLEHYKFNGFNARGRYLMKSSPEYLKKVKIIKSEISNKYNQKIKNETNLIKKLFLFLKYKREVTREITKLTSLEKLFF